MRIVLLGGGFGDRRLRIVLDWTVALFFRPDITKVDLTPEPVPERDHYRHPMAGGIFHDPPIRADQ